MLTVATSPGRAVVTSPPSSRDPERTVSTEIRIPPPNVGAEEVHLAIAWCAEQPQLVGYTAGVTGPCLLGRGGPLPTTSRRRSCRRAARSRRPRASWA